MFFLVPWAGKPTIKSRFAVAQIRQLWQLICGLYVAGQIITCRPAGVWVISTEPEGTTTTTGPIFHEAFRSASQSESAERLIVNSVLELICLMCQRSSPFFRGLCVYVKPLDCPLAWISSNSSPKSRAFPFPGKSPATACLQSTPSGMASIWAKNAAHGVFTLFQWMDTGPASP